MAKMQIGNGLMIDLGFGILIPPDARFWELDDNGKIIALNAGRARYRFERQRTRNDKSKAERGRILSPILRSEILQRQQGKCLDCGIPEWEYKKRFDAHRLKPGRDGGLYTAENVVLLCRECHRSREGKGG